MEARPGEPARRGHHRRSGDADARDLKGTWRLGRSPRDPTRSTGTHLPTDAAGTGSVGPAEPGRGPGARGTRPDRRRAASRLDGEGPRGRMQGGRAVPVRSFGGLHRPRRCA